MSEKDFDLEYLRGLRRGTRADQIEKLAQQFRPRLVDPALQARLPVRSYEPVRLGIALAVRSITYNFGGPAVRPFLDAYGLRDVDQAKVDYVCLLDEFF
jgi:hypothetical protein